MSSKLKIGVLGSGAGTNMQSVLDAIHDGTLDAELKIVLADVKEAKILDRAKRNNIPCQWLDCAPFRTKLDGAAEMDGVRTYLDKINAQGGVHGRQVALRTLDDDSQAAKAEANARQLVEKDQVFVLFGSVEGGPSTAVMRVAV